MDEEVEEVGERVKDWLIGFLGSREAGSIMDLPWDPAVLDAPPPPPSLNNPLLVSPESPIWTLRFVMLCVHNQILGQGRWV